LSPTSILCVWRAGALQTQLSHTNVRAKQNKIPNAYLRNPLTHYTSLIDTPVRLTVNTSGVFIEAVSERVYSDAVQRRNMLSITSANRYQRPVVRIDLATKQPKFSQTLSFFCFALLCFRSI
jgi:hypothetical protein